jgi:hypothetical protein
MQRQEFLILHVPAVLSFLDPASVTEIVEHLMSTYPASSDLRHEQAYLCDLLGEKVGQVGAVSSMMETWARVGAGATTSAASAASAASTA